MRSITSLALCLLTVLTLATSCSSSSTSKRSVAADDETSVQKEYRTGKRLINETNY